MGRYVHTNWGAQYRGAVSPASLQQINEHQLSPPAVVVANYCYRLSSRKVAALYSSYACAKFLCLFVLIIQIVLFKRHIKYNAQATITTQMGQ